ncbi:MAG: histidinol-phosphate phosphatase family protein [Bacteroidia bacterium]
MENKPLEIDKTWTLFLDRDGVINRRLVDDYVKNWEGFEFLEKVPETIASLSEIFGVVVIVTNQQGIGKELMTENDLTQIHAKMIAGIQDAGGRIDKVYHCPMLTSDENNCRKPLPTMGFAAKNDFPSIDFSKCVMVGDSISDMEFGSALGMINIFITPELNKSDENLTQFEATKLCDITSILHGS